MRRRGGKRVNPPHVKLTAQKGQGRDKEGEPEVKFLLSSSHSGISREQVAGHISNFTLSDGKVQINEEIRSLVHFIGSLLIFYPSSKGSNMSMSCIQTLDGTHLDG